jgi:hypothetical protein
MESRRARRDDIFLDRSANPSQSPVGTIQDYVTSIKIYLSSNGTSYFIFQRPNMVRAEGLVNGLGPGVGRTQIQTRSQDQNKAFKNVDMLFISQA